MFGNQKLTPNSGYVGATTITRELFLRADGGLGSRPIAEISSLATGKHTIIHKPKSIQDSLVIGNSSTGRLQIFIDIGSTTAPSFSLNLFSSSAEATVLTYTLASKTLTLDTTNAGYGQPGTWSAVLDILSNNILGLDILLDRSTLEIFGSDGTAITASIYPRYSESTGIVLVAGDGVVATTNITLTPFSSSWSKTKQP